MNIHPLVSIIVVTYNRKDEVVDCVNSILQSSYKNVEIIVVDNASDDGTINELQLRYSDRIELIKSEINLYASGGRNLGAKFAKGEYLLFIDSDNVIDTHMVEYLIRGVLGNEHISIGMSGPFTFCKSEPKRLCWVNNSISLLTSITLFNGVGEIDYGQYEGRGFIRVGHIPNVFMVSKDIFKIVGGIDSDYMMHYEESDLAEKIRKAGFDIILFPKAKTWHSVSLKREEGHKSFKGNNRSMVYYVVRNRIYFMRKNSRGACLFLFLVLFSNIFLVYNITILLFNGNPGLIRFALKGHWDGLFKSLVKR